MVTSHHPSGFSPRIHIVTISHLWIFSKFFIWKFPQWLPPQGQVTQFHQQSPTKSWIKWQLQQKHFLWQITFSLSPCSHQMLLLILRWYYDQSFTDNSNKLIWFCVDTGSLNSWFGIFHHWHWINLIKYSYCKNRQGKMMFLSHSTWCKKIKFASIANIIMSTNLVNRGIKTEDMNFKITCTIKLILWLKILISKNNSPFLSLSCFLTWQMLHFVCMHLMHIMYVVITIEHGTNEYVQFFKTDLKMKYCYHFFGVRYFLFPMHMDLVIFEGNCLLFSLSHLFEYGTCHIVSVVIQQADWPSSHLNNKNLCIIHLHHDF